MLQHVTSTSGIACATVQALKAAAASAECLKKAEQLLQEAISIAQQLAEEEGGLLVQSNKGCAAELEAADGARSALAMLMCQAGRDSEAGPLLKALGFKYRLSREVGPGVVDVGLSGGERVIRQGSSLYCGSVLYQLCSLSMKAMADSSWAACCIAPGITSTVTPHHHGGTFWLLVRFGALVCFQVLQYYVPGPSSKIVDASQACRDEGQVCSPCSFMQAVDDALPPALLQHLQDVFRPGADFWLQHAYGRVGYFSYFFKLVRPCREGVLTLAVSMLCCSQHLSVLDSHFKHMFRRGVGIRK